MNQPLTTAAEWTLALAAYQTARAYSDSLSNSHPNVDAAVNAYCAAMDHLIETVRAPDLSSLGYKLDLIGERYEDFILPDEVLAAIRADVAALDVAQKQEG